MEQNEWERLEKTGVRESGRERETQGRKCGWLGRWFWQYRMDFLRITSGKTNGSSHSLSSISCKNLALWGQCLEMGHQISLRAACYDVHQYSQHFCTEREQIGDDSSECVFACVQYIVMNTRCRHFLCWCKQEQNLPNRHALLPHGWILTHTPTYTSESLPTSLPPSQA